MDCSAFRLPSTLSISHTLKHTYTHTHAHTHTQAQKHSPTNTQIDSNISNIVIGKGAAKKRQWKKNETLEIEKFKQKGCFRGDKFNIKI